MTYSDFFASLWQQFIAVTPQANTIQQRLSERGEQVINDHVAFRTFADSAIGMAQLVPQLEAMGYRHFQDYDFSAKKLTAASYLHPDPGAPKIFLSELHTDQLSKNAQAILQPILDAISAIPVTPQTLFAGRLWDPISYTDYMALADESEYAGWLAAWGMRANHFTVDVNRLTGFQTLQQLNQFVTESGFPLNQSGGEIKGTPDDLLEQSSTLADIADVEFADGHRAIPSCFYEFALRHPDATGQLYQGFVAANANKIFESTDRQK